MKSQAKKKGSRMGVHSDEVARVQAYLQKRRKALGVLACTVMDITVTSIIGDAFDRAAIQAGVVDKDGNIKPEYQDLYDIILSKIEGETSHE